MGDKFLPDFIRVEFQDIFNKFDKDGSNTISVDEISEVFQRLGYDFEEENKHELINKIDKDNSGAIDFSEFCSLIAMKLKVVENDYYLREAFKIIDDDCDGFINISEFKLFMQEVQQDMSENDIKDLFNLIDLDNNGLIDYEELMVFIMKKE